MDEVNVNSIFMRKIIATALEDMISEKMGLTPVLRFNDAIKATFDDESGVFLHLNMDVMMSQEDFEKLVTGSKPSLEFVRL